MQKVLNFFRPKKEIDYKTEVLSGLTVALALVPEAIAFALIAGLSPLTGLYAAFVMGLVTAIFGGRPGMISGATGAIAIVIVNLVVEHGVEYVFATMVLAGIIQILAGVFKLGKFIRLVPQSVMYGFVNGLAIVIFMAQIPQFQIDGEWMTGETLYYMLGLVLVTMLIIWGLPKFTKAIPSSLAAILIVFGIVALLKIDSKTVGDLASIEGGFPPFHIPDLPINLDSLFIILPYAFIVAAVGLIESLLTLNLVDEITETRGSSNRESVAQGIGNFLSGLFSGMGGCAMIGQSLINISNGARTRISGIVAAVMLLVFVMFGSGLIEQVPMAALTGLMIMVSIGTFEWGSLRVFGKIPMHDIFVMLVVMGVTVFLHNLALAVLIGVIISALVFSWQNATRIRARKRLSEDEQTLVYEIWGPLFFGSISAFNSKFDAKNDPPNVEIDFIESRVSDHSAIEAVFNLVKKYETEGKSIKLKHLSQDCKTILYKSSPKFKEVIVEDIDDPRYHLAENPEAFKKGLAEYSL